MSGRGTGDDYTPHPGDPWHPDWAAGKEEADDEFVVEAAAEEAVEADSKRGLFGRRRKRAEADLESVTVEEFEQSDEIDEVAIEGGSSVDAYEALRDAELDDDPSSTGDDDVVRAAGTSGIDLSIAPVAGKALEETEVEEVPAPEVVETLEPEAEAVVEEVEEVPAPEVVETLEPEAEAVVEEVEEVPAPEVVETLEPEAEAVVEEVEEVPAPEVVETLEPEAEAVVEEVEEVPAPEVVETLEPEAEAVVEEVEEVPAPEVVETLEPEAEAVVEEVEEVPAPEVVETLEPEAEAVVEEVEEVPAPEVVETLEPEAEAVVEEVEEVPAPEVVETLEPEAEAVVEEVEEVPAPEVVETLEPEAEAVVEEVEEVPAPEVVETLEPEAEAVVEEVEEVPAPEVVETLEPEAEAVVEEVEEVTAPEVVETLEPEAEAVVEEVEEVPAPEVVETLEPEAEAVVEEVEEVPAPEVVETLEPEAEAVVEEVEEVPAPEVVETLEPEAEAVVEEVEEVIEPAGAPSAVAPLIEADVPKADRDELVEPEVAVVAESLEEAELGQLALTETEETEVETAAEELAGKKMFGGAGSETTGAAVLGGAAASGATELAPEEVLGEGAPKVGWWRRTFGASTPEPKEPVDPMAGVVEDDAEIETWPEYLEGQEEDGQEMASDTGDEYETAATVEASDIAVAEEAEPKRGWWRRGKEKDLESGSTIGAALDRSEGEPGTEDSAMSATAAEMSDVEAESVDVDSEAEADAVAEAADAGLGEAVHREADLDEEAKVAGVGFFGRLLGRSTEAAGATLDETVDDTPVTSELAAEAEAEPTEYPSVTSELAAEAEAETTEYPSVTSELAAEAEADTDNVDEWVAYAGVGGDAEEVDEAQPAEVAEPEPKLTRRQRRKAEKAAAAAAAALAAEAAADEMEDDSLEGQVPAPEPTELEHTDDVDEWVAYAGVGGDAEEVDEAQPAEVAEPEPKLTRRQRRKAEKAAAAAAAALAAEAAADEMEDGSLEGQVPAPEPTEPEHTDDVDEWVAYAGVGGDAEEVDEAQPAEVAEPEPKLTRRQRRKAEKAAAAAAAALAAADESSEEREREAAVGASDGGAGAEDERFFDDGPDRGDDLTEEQYVSASTREHLGLAAAVAAETGEDDEVQAVAASMPGVESGVVGFGDVVDSAETDEAEAARQVDQRDLTVRVVTGVALAGLFLGAVLWGPWALGLLLVLVMLIALSEFYGVLLRNGHQPLAIFGIIGGFIALVGTAVSGAVAVPGALIITSIVMFFFYALEPERTAPLTNSSLTLMGMAWVTGFSAVAMTILESPDFRVLVLAVVALTVFMDTASYFSGRSWGRRKLAPKLSPNKTVEGLIGGVVVVLLTGAVIGTVEPFDLQAGLALAAVVAVVAPLGDLAMSVFKRTLGVKDMGVILPGHGGILDRIDSLLFVIPAAWATFHALGYVV